MVRSTAAGGAVLGGFCWGARSGPWTQVSAKERREPGAPSVQGRATSGNLRGRAMPTLD